MLDWNADIARIREYRAVAIGQQGSSQDASSSDISARDRIKILSDSGSFTEVGALVGSDDDGKFIPVNIVAGSAIVENHPCLIASDNFKVGGGTYTPSSLKKGAYVEQLAIQRKVPLIRFLEGGGARVSGSHKQRGRSGYDFTAPQTLNILAMQAIHTVPVVCAALGPCAGYSAVRLVASHFSIMMRGTSQVFTGGPSLVKESLRIDMSKEELGGANVHGKSGVVSNIAETEEDACKQIKQFLSYMPRNVWELPPVREYDTESTVNPSELDSIIPYSPRRIYDIRRIIQLIFDADSFFEVGRHHAPGQITGFARISGHPVAVFSSDCSHLAGGMTAAGARKVARFISTCDTFNIPIVSLVDEPGFSIGPEAEAEATVRAGMSTMCTILQSKVPWIAFILRRSVGVAQGLHYGPQCEVYAWPSATASAMPVESGVKLAFRKEIANASDPKAREQELIAEMREAQGIFPRALDFSIHELIIPSETPSILREWIGVAWSRLPSVIGPMTYGMSP